ncbi:hypothetical protein LINPERHAP2_LOCUS11684 [Linum perenne]
MQKPYANLSLWEGWASVTFTISISLF